MKDQPLKSVVYQWMIPYLSDIARRHGYALAVHGSMSRDLDLIAVPWVHDAGSPEVLVEAFRACVEGIIHSYTNDANGNPQRNPTCKPHGRKSWSIYFSGHVFYIDLSVMPRVRDYPPDGFDPVI